MERGGQRAWLALCGLLVVAFIATVVILNSTVYSASGFVSSYLSAIDRHDISGALAMPGVTLPSGGSRVLLRSDAVVAAENVRLVSDATGPDGRHTLVYSSGSGATAHSTTFTVERSGTLLALFSGWRFAASPVATLAVTPEHAASVIVNGLAFIPSGGANTATKFLALAPSQFTLSHRSTYLAAKKTTVVVGQPGGIVDAKVNVQATAAFVHEVQKQLDAYLAMCVTQKVLLPTGCPMGEQIDDRIQDTPAWSMVTNPMVTIVPGTDANTWQVPRASARAHLVVTVKSIFDGTVSTFDRDVPFTVSYLVTIRGDGSLLIAQQ
jgi:hypothetical protein